MRFTRTHPSASLATATATFGLSRSFTAVCASPYDRSAVRPTTFNSHPPRMDIHSTRRSFQRTSASLPLPLSLLFPRYLSAIHPSFSLPFPICIRNPCLSVSYTRLTKYYTVNISRKESLNAAKTANSYAQSVIPYNIACLGDARCLHHANRLFDRHRYLLLVTCFVHPFPSMNCKSFVPR